MSKQKNPKCYERGLEEIEEMIWLHHFWITLLVDSKDIPLTDFFYPVEQARTNNAFPDDIIMFRPEARKRFIEKCRDVADRFFEMNCLYREHDPSVRQEKSFPMVEWIHEPQGNEGWKWEEARVFFERIREGEVFLFSDQFKTENEISSVYQGPPEISETLKNEQEAMVEAKRKVSDSTEFTSKCRVEADRLLKDAPDVGDRERAKAMQTARMKVGDSAEFIEELGKEADRLFKEDANFRDRKRFSDQERIAKQSDKVPKQWEEARRYFRKIREGETFTFDEELPLITGSSDVVEVLKEEQKAMQKAAERVRQYEEFVVERRWTELISRKIWSEDSVCVSEKGRLELGIDRELAKFIGKKAESVPLETVCHRVKILLFALHEVVCDAVGEDEIPWNEDDLRLGQESSIKVYQQYERGRERFREFYDVRCRLAGRKRCVLPEKIPCPEEWKKDLPQKVVISVARDHQKKDKDKRMISQISVPGVGNCARKGVEKAILAEKMLLALNDAKGRRMKKKDLVAKIGAKSIHDPKYGLSNWVKNENVLLILREDKEHIWLTENVVFNN